MIEGDARPVSPVISTAANRCDMTEQTLKRVYIVDDEQLVRKTLAEILSGHSYDLVSFASGHQFLEVCDELTPGCVLLDVNMPDRDGLSVLGALKKKSSFNFPIIMMSGYGDIPLVVNAMQIGAVSFIEKPFKAKALREEVAKAIAGLQQQSSADVPDLDDTRFSELTKRELEVLKLVVKGLQNKEIAESLGISHRTVESHRSQAMQRVGARTTAELVRLAIAAGIES